MQLSVHIVASVARHVVARPLVHVGDQVLAEAGAVVVGRVLDDKAVYNHLEDIDARLRKVRRGQIVVGALGVRSALRGYAGDVPSQLAVGETLHLLNTGGVMGRCTSFDPAVGPPARVEVLGAVLRGGVPANLAPGPVPRLARVGALPPIVLIAGTCMHAGKTAAGAAVVRAATAAGLHVAAAKLTGVALRRDALELHAAGARHVLTFADAGLPSTCTGDVVGAARGVLAALADTGPDLIVGELGDGLLGDYHVADVLSDPDLGRSIVGVVLSATDPVAAWGAATLVRSMGLQPTVITGPATDNAAGVLAVERATGIPAVNARRDPDGLAAVALRGLRRPVAQGAA